jgi:hypothetical protein
LATPGDALRAISFKDYAPKASNWSQPRQSDAFR